MLQLAGRIVDWPKQHKHQQHFEHVLHSLQRQQAVFF